MESQKGQPLGFRISEKVGGISNEIFPLVIITTIKKFHVSMMLIDLGVGGGRSCEILYTELFKKLGLRREKLCPYEGSDLHAFNDMVTYS